MSTFVIDLGFNWSSAPIGNRLNSILVEPIQKTPDVDVYPLQIPLLNADEPEYTYAWYTDLEKNDELIFRISDISTGSDVPAPKEMALQLAVLFSAPGQGSMDHPEQPIVMPARRRLPGGSGFQKNKHVLFFDKRKIKYKPRGRSQVYPAAKAVWYVDAKRRRRREGRKLRLVRKGTFEMSLVLKVSTSCESRYFSVDPEMIVGEHDTPPTRSS